MKKIFIVVLSIPFYMYYCVKGFIIACKEPENGRTSEEIVHDMIKKDKDRIEKLRNKLTK